MSQPPGSLAVGSLGQGRRRQGPVAALDVGGGKVTCLVGAPRRHGEFDLLGVGHRVAQGLRGGEIVDFQAVQASILAAVQEAEQAAGVTLRNVIVVTAVGRPVSSTLELDVRLSGRAVAGQDITRLLVAARARAADPERVVLHVLPGAIAIDGRPTMRDPRGMRAGRLGLNAIVVHAAAAPLRQLIGCVESCHLKVENVVASAYATAYACLTREEVEFGTVLLDLGADVTGLAVFGDGRVFGLGAVPLGGAHVTRDLAIGLRTTRVHAERLKTLYGSVRSCPSDERQKIVVPRIGDGGDVERGEESRARLTDVIRPRLQETLGLVQDQIRTMMALPNLTTRSHLVLAGGASDLDGLSDLAADLFDMDARSGRPACLWRADGQAEDRAGFAAAAGALALSAVDDGGLGFLDQSGSALAPARWSKIGQWWREMF
jgi:cell division protein FtsA